MPKYIKDTPFRILSSDEERRILVTLNKLNNRERLKNLFLILRTTGFRISEVLSLKIHQVWSGIDVRETIALHKENTKGKKRGRIGSLHYENDKTRRELRKYLLDLEKQSGHLNSESWLFPTRNGNHWDRSNAYDEWLELLKMAGVQSCGFHALRRTKISNFYKSSKDFVLTQQMAGHSKPQTTEGYIYFDVQELHRVNLLSSLGRP